MRKKKYTNSERIAKQQVLLKQMIEKIVILETKFENLTKLLLEATKEEQDAE